MDPTKFFSVLGVYDKLIKSMELFCWIDIEMLRCDDIKDKLGVD